MIHKNVRTIISHASKILLRVILGRMKMDMEVAIDKAGLELVEILEIK